MISRSDWEPLPTPTLIPFARGYLSLCRFFTAAVWCVPALRVPLVHSLINHFRRNQKNQNKYIPTCTWTDHRRTIRIMRHDHEYNFYKRSLRPTVLSAYLAIFIRIQLLQALATTYGLICLSGYLYNLLSLESVLD